MFKVSQDGSFVDLIYTNDRIMLSRIPALESESGKEEFYILNDDVTPIRYDNSDNYYNEPEPYFDIEQALDDFEYRTETIPEDIIQEFKDRIRYSTPQELQSSSKEDHFFVTKEGDTFILSNPLHDVQLNYVIPESKYEDTFYITNLDFQPIEDYEVLSKPFTSDLKEALENFEDVLNIQVPSEVIKRFRDISYL